MYSRNLVIYVGFLLIWTQLISSLPQHFLAKRSTFFEIDCGGVFDKSIFFHLDRICEDCYSLFREPDLYILCKKRCFTTDYFKGCVDALQLTDEQELIKNYIKQANGGEPLVLHH